MNTEASRSAGQPIGPIDAAMYRAMVERYNELVRERADEGAEFRKALSNLESSMGDLRISCQSLMHECQCLRNERDAERASNSHLHSSLVAVQNENAVLRNQKELLEGEVLYVKEQRRACLDEIERLKKRIAGTHG